MEGLRQGACQDRAANLRTPDQVAEGAPLHLQEGVMGDPGPGAEEADARLRKTVVKTPKAPATAERAASPVVQSEEDPVGEGLGAQDNLDKKGGQEEDSGGDGC